MANIPDVNFNKIPDKSVKFNQTEYYEDNFDKINTELIPQVNAQLNDIEQDKAEKTDVGLLSGLLTTAKTSIVAAINELFNSKANKAQEAWITPVLSNGWTGDLQYYKDSLGIVRFRGSVRGGALAVTMFFLPSGYRPGPIYNSFPIVSNGLFGHCLVQNAGAVQIIAGSNNNVYLDSVTFKAV